MKTTAFHPEALMRPQKQAFWQVANYRDGLWYFLAARVFLANHRITAQGLHAFVNPEDH